MKLFLPAGLSLLILASSASACMIFNGIYNISSQILTTSILFDNGDLVAIDMATPIPFHQPGGSGAMISGVFAPVFVHHDGNMNFAVSLTPEGRETLAFGLKRKCREWEKVVEGEGGPLYGDCITLDLYAFEYGCSDAEIEESKSFVGATLEWVRLKKIRRRGLAAF